MALDAMVYITVGIISAALLVMIAKSIHPIPMEVLDEEGVAEKALLCYTRGECGTYKAEIRNITYVEVQLELYHVPYRIEWEGGESIYIAREDGEVVIYG